MPVQFKLPEVGENIDKAEIGNLKVAIGDVIAPGQVVMEVETEKAVFDLPCPTGGKVLKIHVKSGDSVPVGAPLLTIGETATQEESAAEPGAGSPRTEKAAATAPQPETSRKPVADSPKPAPATSTPP